MFSPQRLKSRRQELGLSQSDIANQLKLNRSSYSSWESGRAKPNQKNLERLGEILKVDEDYFNQGYEMLSLYQQLTEDNKITAVNFTQELLTQQVAAPSNLISLESARSERFEYHVYERLSAGTGFSYFNDGNYDTIFYDEELDHDFASWVFGDSMEPTYLNGEVALIKNTGFDYDGAIYAVDWDDQTYIKKVYREADGLRLVSLNKKYADKFVPYDENPRIIGKIVGHFMPMSFE
ncbi:XRE family transcriptional regulator [Streptococcus caprae]|uniref:XRE family transcriptional regulator n=1 Tax=Streptococcus caprae TaxID=1640501 RepID=A0ABV8CYL5_9STRE